MKLWTYHICYKLEMLDVCILDFMIWFEMQHVLVLEPFS